MEARKQNQEEQASGNLGKIRLGKKTVLIPEMNRAVALLLAAATSSISFKRKKKDWVLPLTPGSTCISCPSLTALAVSDFTTDFKESCSIPSPG